MSSRIGLEGLDHGRRILVERSAMGALGPLLPKNQPGAPRRTDDRQVISGIVHVLKAGCRRQDCPAVYGPSTTVHNRFRRWPAPLSSRTRSGPVISNNPTRKRHHPFDDTAYRAISAITGCAIDIGCDETAGGGKRQSGAERDVRLGRRHKQRWRGLAPLLRNLHPIHRQPPFSNTMALP
jgi:transposase